MPIDLRMPEGFLQGEMYQDDTLGVILAIALVVMTLIVMIRVHQDIIRRG